MDGHGSTGTSATQSKIPATHKKSKAKLSHSGHFPMSVFIVFEARMGLKRCSSFDDFLLYRKRNITENLENVNYDIPLFETMFLFQTPIPISPAKVETHEERCRTG